MFIIEVRLLEISQTKIIAIYSGIVASPPRIVNSAARTGYALTRDAAGSKDLSVKALLY
jgi:hypothetical protein